MKTSLASSPPQDETLLVNQQICAPYIAAYPKFQLGKENKIFIAVNCNNNNGLLHRLVQISTEFVYHPCEYSSV